MHRLSLPVCCLVLGAGGAAAATETIEAAEDVDALPSAGECREPLCLTDFDCINAHHMASSSRKAHTWHVSATKLSPLLVGCLPVVVHEI